MMHTGPGRQELSRAYVAEDCAEAQMARGGRLKPRRFRPASRIEGRGRRVPGCAGMLLSLVTNTPFYVRLMLRESSQGLMGPVFYKLRIFGTHAVHCLLRDFQQVLNQMITGPDLRVCHFS